MCHGPVTGVCLSNSRSNIPLTDAPVIYSILLSRFRAVPNEISFMSSRFQARNYFTDLSAHAIDDISYRIVLRTRDYSLSACPAHYKWATL